MLHQQTGSSGLRVEKLKPDTQTKTIQIVAHRVEYTRK